MVAQTKPTKQFNNSEPLVLTVAEFCLRHRISRSFFYKLVKNGQGPALMRLALKY